MIDEQQYKALLEETLLPMLSTATGAERAIVSVLVAILSELRTNREATVALYDQFNKVSAGGNSLLTESA